jgi:4-hydroxybutyryl-CoA dehydratase/vinylacetyl-CoA-Delta-isomerase
MSLHVVKKKDNGIIVKGAKTMICGVAASNEIFIMPGTALKEADKDYAVSFVIPRDIDNLTIVETRRPSDIRELEDGFDIPVDIGGITQAYLLFEDVFIPEERVFMCGEYDYTLNTVMNFIALYRAAIGGCVAGQGDAMIGAAALMARANGLSEKVFRDKITEMIINNETTFGMGIAAGVLGKKHPSGVWIPNQLLSNVNKVNVGRFPYDTKRLTQDIAGGIAETGCLPSCKDISDQRYGDLLKKYLKANCSGETRAKIARLIEWLTIGAGVPGCMHGGGSPDSAKLVINAKTNINQYIDLAKRLANIDEDIQVESNKK